MQLLIILCTLASPAHAEAVLAQAEAALDGVVSKSLRQQLAEERAHLSGLDKLVSAAQHESELME